MRTVYTLLAIAFFVVAPLWYGFVIVNDLNDPELWNQDWTHDPRIYLPALAIVVPLCGLAWRWAYRKSAQRSSGEKRKW